jgi:hypothetical protein
MCVTVDEECLPAEELGLRTVGQLLAHLRVSNRLVTRLVIDGEAPNLSQLGTIQNLPLEDHVLFIETADPCQAAMDALDQADALLSRADEPKSQAADLLRANQWTPALAKLGECLNCWQESRKTVLAVGRLLQINLDSLTLDSAPLSRFVNDFARQLREIQSAIESADPVALTDLLVYDTAETNQHWRAALRALRMMIHPLQHVQSAI